MGLEKSLINNLYELFAKDVNRARDVEIFTSLAYSIKQRVGKKWFESLLQNSDKKRLFILSFEYSFGDKLFKNLVKLDLLDETKSVLEKYNKNFDDIVAQDIDFALGFSELGDLSTELIEQLANNKENVYSYGLRYRRGMLKQEIVNGEQIEKPDDWQVNRNPWEHEKSFSHIVRFKDFAVKAIPYDLPILSNDGEYANTLRLWKSHSIENLDFKKFSSGNILESYENINRSNAIVEFLYPDENTLEGSKLRLMQEYFYASASIQDIIKKYEKYVKEDIRKIYKHTKIQINDVHTIIAIPIFIDIMITKYGLSFEESLKLAKKVFVFLHVTLLPESFRKWRLDIIDSLTPNLIDIYFKLDLHIKEELAGKSDEYIESLQILKDGQVNPLNIAYHVSKNIISFNNDFKYIIKNTELKYHYDYYNEKINSIDFNVDMKQYIKEMNIEEDRIYIPKDDINYNKYNLIKRKNKEKLIDYINYDKRLINLDSPFIMHIGVFHEYKRQILSILGIALQYFRLKKNINLDIPERTYFFAGKSYPNYYIAKESIKFINALAKLINNDLFIKDKIKIVFVPNYDANKESVLLPSADIFQKLDIYELEKNPTIVEKALLSGSKLVISNSSLKNMQLSDENINLYNFGDSREKIYFNKDDSYNFHNHLNNNPEILEMFEFYKNNRAFSSIYNIEKIYNAIYYYDDNFRILKDLNEYVDKLEEAIKDYTYEEKWVNNIIDNFDKVNFESTKENIKSYLDGIGGIDD